MHGRIDHEDGRGGRAERIATRMAAIRGELRDDASEMRRSAKHMLDWQAHVRQHPWGALALATALGYLLVPKRVEIRSPTSDELEKLAKKHHLVVDADPEPQSKSTMWSGLMSFAAHALMRSAMGYVGQRAGEMLQPKPVAGGGESAAESEEAAASSAAGRRVPRKG